ncbi:MAG: CehA/McbA family metallohydrolase [Myxococcota bacterium]|nr:CehA/McbA family metallohydrolase [Myxococcota bacterium]
MSRAVGCVGLALLLGLAACGDAAPRSSAYRIGSLDDAIGGPHAIGTIGDFMLENDQIRVVIADTGINTADPSKTTYGRVNTTFGGSLVDADIRRVGGGGGRGNDQLAELLPGFVFSVISPTKVEITKDGTDGRAAEVKVSGTGGDLLQMVSLLNVGLVNAANLEFSQTYRLHPGQSWVEIETTVKNKAAGAHPFPYFQPSELKALGLDVPGIENLMLSVPMGQLPLLGGEQDLFAPGRAGFNVQYAIEDTYKIAGGFPGFPGMVIDFLASRGVGVSYGLTMPASPDNYVNRYKSQYPGQEITPYSMLVPFTYAGVAAAYMYAPPAQLLSQQEFTFTSYFVVGDGDVASVADSIYKLRGVPTGTFGGRVIDKHSQAPVVGADVIILDGQGRTINQLETDVGGAFLGKLVPGDYSYQVLSDDRLPTVEQRITITAGQQTGRLVQMDAPATIAVSVRDEQGRQAPAKIQLIGRFDQANQSKDPRGFLYSLARGESIRPTAFDGGNRFVEKAWWTKDGRVSAQVRPGTYELVVSRGPEYELTTKMVELTEGAFVAEQLTLVPAFASDGWVAGDFHLHAMPSTDSGLPIIDRVVSCAAEGLEVAVATDHNYVTDYAPAIAASGLDPWLLGIPGMELTTFEMGHFNGYPLKIDPGSTRGGEFVWNARTPQQLFDQLRALAIDKDTAIVQVNHPRQQVLGYFAQFFIDDATALPYTPAGILGVFAPYGDEFAAENFSVDFDAVELLTGTRTEDIHSFRAPNPLPPGPHPDPQPVPGQIVVGPDGRAKFPGVVETWFAMLDRGHRATGMGVSDSHHLLGHEPGYARTMLYVGSGKDVPGGFTRDDVIGAIREHRAITTNAPFLEMSAPGGAIGDTVQGQTVELTIRVRAPTWAKVDRLVVYSNSAIVSPTPIVIPEGQGHDFETRVTVRSTRDAWVVAEVTGSANMFPVLSPTEFPPLDATVIIQALSVGLDLSTLPIASNLKPERVHFSTPYAITNPIWIDADSNGSWTPPKPPFASRRAPVGPTPDVRMQFDAVQELGP